MNMKVISIDNGYLYISRVLVNRLDNTLMINLDWALNDGESFQKEHVDYLMRHFCIVISKEISPEKWLRFKDMSIQSLSEIVWSDILKVKSLPARTTLFQRTSFIQNAENFELNELCYSILEWVDRVFPDHDLSLAEVTV